MIFNVVFKRFDKLPREQRTNGAAGFGFERTEIKLPEALARICFEGLLHFGRFRDVRGNLFLPEVAALRERPDFGFAHVSLSPWEHGEPANQQSIARHGGSPLWGEVGAHGRVSTNLVWNPGQIIVGNASALLALLDLGILFKRKLRHQLPYPGKIVSG